MNARIESQPKRGTGCFAKGCLTLIVLAFLLIVVGIGGSLWVRNRYISDKPVPIPQTAVPAESKTAVEPRQPSVATPPPQQRSAEVREQLDTLKQSARAHEPNEVILTAADINSLIAANRKSSGMASVGIAGNVAQVQFSIPLERLDARVRDAFGVGDRYLNGSAKVVAPPGTNAANVQLSDLTINGHSLPINLLDLGLPGGRSLRSYVINYASQYGITDGEIRDGKVILHTSGY
jgi:hypothetical protein